MKLENAKYVFTAIFFVMQIMGASEVFYHPVTKEWIKIEVHQID